MRVGDYSANARYTRKRIDFNVFDDIGEGHKIHAASFTASPVKRQSSVDSWPAFDTSDSGSCFGDSALLKNPTLTIRRGPSMLSGMGPRNPSVIGGGTFSRAGARSTAMKFPAAPSSFPKVPTASVSRGFGPPVSVVPEDIESDVGANNTPITIRQAS